MFKPRSDSYFMQEALSLAKKGEGYTSPNPLVGAVIVNKSKIIARGYHKKCGLAHAEIEAIRKTNPGSCRGATLYVSLEPCFHFGRTPPCVDTIIARKFKAVVIAVKDPTGKVNGKSIRKLKSCGIKVKLGLLGAEARKLNQVFFKNAKTAMPFVVGKVAQSLDGKIATCGGQSQWITSSESRCFAKSLRDKYDCVLVGANTVIKDNPRLEGLNRTPFRVVIDSGLNIPPSAYILKNNPKRTIVITTPKRKKELKKIPAAVQLVFINKDKKGNIPVKKILKALFGLGIMSVFVEGGSETIGRFFDQKLIDKVYFFIAPKIIGGETALSSIGAKGIVSLETAPILKDIEMKRIKQDIVISGYPQY